MHQKAKRHKKHIPNKTEPSMKGCSDGRPKPECDNNIAPPTPRLLNRLEPKRLPIINPHSPLRAPTREVTSSGKEVPIATKENPMKPPSQPNSFPIETAELTIQRGDRTVSARPIVITMISRDTGQLCFLGE